LATGLWNPRESFARIARLPDAAIDLAEAALLIAAEEYPFLDVAGYLARLDALAEAAGPRVREAGSAADRVSRLNHYLFVEQGFTGNRERYDDPRNSFLNEVLDRGCGIPITLSVVYVEVARRLGLPVHGVGFPGHFIAKYEGSPEILIDPFFGRVLSEDECQQRLRALLGAQEVLDPGTHLRPATRREILVRMLGNLKHLHVKSADFGRALACCERILLLDPDSPLELRDRGVVYQQLECFGAALADFERFLALAPDDESAPAVRAKLAGLEHQVLRLH
jgi:regulator of sirC expression with transglutaminase-like and TPR domain